MTAEIYKLLYAKEFYQIDCEVYDTLEKNRDKLLIKISGHFINPCRVEDYLRANLKNKGYRCKRWNRHSNLYEDINKIPFEDNYDYVFGKLKDLKYIIYKTKKVRPKENRLGKEVMKA
jgi:hypothetical protein